MTKKKVTTKRPAKGKAEGSKKSMKGAQPSTLTPEQFQQIEAEAEGFRLKVHEYATKAYMTAVEHFERHHADPFALSRLAVVYGEQQPGDFNMVVTLPGVMDGKVITEAQARKAISDAEVLARTLEHDGCTDAFRTVCSAILAEHVISESDVDWFMSPQAVRVMLPLTLFSLWREHNGAVDEPANILLTLSNELVSDETATAVRAALGKQ